MVSGWNDWIWRVPYEKVMGNALDISELTKVDFPVFIFTISLKKIDMNNIEVKTLKRIVISSQL